MQEAVLQIDEDNVKNDSSVNSQHSTATKMPDDDPPDDDVEIEGVDPGTIDERWTPPWSDNIEEWCRAHIFNRMCNSEIAGNILIENMELCYQWIRNGKTPEKPNTKIKSVKP